MADKRNQWIDANQAAAILTKNSGHEVTSDYVRLLARNSKIRARAKDGRTKEYYRPDIEGYEVREKRKSTDAA